MKTPRILKPDPSIPTAPVPSTRIGDMLPDVTGLSLEEFFQNYNLAGYDNGDAELSCSVAKYNAGSGEVELKALSFSPDHPTHAPNLLDFDRRGNGNARLAGEAELKNLEHGVYHNFKKCPGEGDDLKYLHGENSNEDAYTYAQLMGHSFGAAIKQLFERDNDQMKMINRENPTFILVGRPAGSRWAEKEQEYAKILTQYLPRYLPKEQADKIKVLILSESLASMAGALDLKQELWQNVITQILDLGSSTFDITTIIPENLRKTGIISKTHFTEDSYQFGGNLLDERMADYGDFLYQQEYPASQGYVIEPYLGKIPSLRFKKEKCVGDNGADLDKKCRESYNYIVCKRGDDGSIEEQDVDPFSYYINKTTLNAVLNGVHKDKQTDQEKKLALLACKPVHLCKHGIPQQDSWMAACEYIFTQFYQQTNKAIGGNPSDRRIILTGGVSNMPMVRELAKQCFKVEELYPAKYPPSQIVSMGLALVLSTEVRKKFLQKELEQRLLTDEKLGMPSAASLQEFLVNEVCEADINYFEKAISAWVRGSEEKALGDCYLCQEHNPDDPNPFYNPDYPVMQRACEKWFKKYGISGRINNLLKDTFHSLFPTINEAFTVDTVMPDLSSLGKIELISQFEINPYMFFDKENCPDDPYDLSRRYTWQQRKEILDIFRRHTDDLVRGVHYDYGNGYAVVIGSMDQKYDTAPNDYTHKVVSLKANYDAQITEAQASRIRERILERMKPQITSFLNQLTYYLNIS